MKGFRTRLFKCGLPLVVMVCMLWLVPSVLGNIRLGGGGEVPFYARIERGESFHTDEWAVIVFYRPPDCVPATFDLLNLFDVPGAFDCGPPTTDGFTIWKNGPGIDPAPIQSNLHGLGAVPVWFVSWSDLQAGLDDDTLTVPELLAMPSLLVGSADFFQETLHPSGTANVPKISFVASGLLQDGRQFQAHASVSAGTYQVLINLK